MPVATFTPNPARGQLQFIRNNVTNNTGAAITLSGNGGQDVVIASGASVVVTKYVNRINRNATNYYIATSPSVTAAAPATVAFPNPNITVTW